MSSADTTQREVGLEKHLHWMLDAPFFIDASQLDSFYDAVLQPKAKSKESISVAITEETAREINKELGVSIDPANIATFLSPLLGTFNVGGKFSDARKKSRLKTRTIELEPIHTPQRQLIQLTTSYLLSYPNQVFFVDDVTTDREWFRSENIKAVPREIVFLDLPSKEEADSYDLPKTMLIPMAVEFASGRIVTLYNKLDAPPRTSSSWSNYIENYSPRKAVKAIEDESEESEKIEWINYRVPLSNNKTARLHFEPNGAYNTGTFAYNLIHMGWKHGLRLIGTVQSEPDVRILAGYRK